jgi:hypothetical protein
MTSSPTPPIPPLPSPRLPSRKVGAILAALMLAAGIALGALIGPGPADSLASSSRAAALARVLTLLALGGGTDSGSDLLLSSGAAHPSGAAPQPKPPSSSKATARTGGASSATGAQSATSSQSGTSSASSPHPSGSTSPTSSTKPAASEGESEKTPKTEPLPPIANVWLVVLPYGGGLANALKQSTAAPYLDGQLLSKGTVLRDYSSLAAGQLAGAATLLSGQVSASVSTIAPPPCDGSTAAGASGPASADTPGANTPGTAAGQGATASAPCPSGEPAGLQAADAFLQEAVAKILASSSYREHGLIVITFAAGAPEETSTSTATTPSADTTEAAGSGITYPAGSLTSTLSAAGSPAGALLLSPFLRHAGTQSSSAFEPAAPRTSLEGLLQTKAAGG